MTKPSAAATLLNPETANSRPTMMQTAQAGASRFSTSEMSAALMSSLSAMGSSRMPKREICWRLRAMRPSRKSVKAAPRKSATPSRWRWTPNQFSEKGVSSTTTSSGTTKMRDKVSAFGRFSTSLPCPHAPRSVVG